MKKVHPNTNNEIVDIEISKLAVETNHLAISVDKAKTAVAELLVSMRDSQISIREAYGNGQKSNIALYTKDIPRMARYYMGIADDKDVIIR